MAEFYQEMDFTQSNANIDVGENPTLSILDAQNNEFNFKVNQDANFDAPDENSNATKSKNSEDLNFNDYEHLDINSKCLNLESDHSRIESDRLNVDSDRLNITDDEIIAFVENNSILISASVDSPLINSNPAYTQIHNHTEKIVFSTLNTRLSSRVQKSKNQESNSKPKNKLVQKDTSQKELEKMSVFTLNLKWFMNSRTYVMEVLDQTIVIGSPDNRKYLLKGHLGQLLKYIIEKTLADPWNYTLTGKSNT